MEHQKKTWRLMVERKPPASRNMAVDEALFRTCSLNPDKFIPTIRFYQWENPTLSFGSSQKIGRAVDLEYCEANGINVVRRPTGGRAVLHDDEVTYSVVAPVNGMFGETIQETYRLISEAILNGLRLMGVSAQTHGKGSDSANGAGYLPCFASGTKYEIAYNERKIVGSAQRRNNRAFLQHGSILLGFDSQMLMRAIGADSSSSDPLNYMTSISEILNKRVDYLSAVGNLVIGFEEEFDVNLETVPLTDLEARSAEFFEVAKYRSDSWNHSK